MTKKLAILWLCSMALCGVEESKAFSLFNAPANGKSEKKVIKKKKEKDSIKKAFLSKSIQWVTLGMIMGGILTYVYTKNQSVVTPPTQETSKEKVEHYKQFLESGTSAKEVSWGRKLTDDKALMGKVKAYVLSQDKDKWKDWILHKHGTLVGDIAAILQQGSIDITLDINRQLVIGGILYDTIDSNIIPLCRAFLLAQLIHLLQAIKGDTKAQEIIKRRESKLLAYVVEKHNNNTQALHTPQESQANGTSKINGIADIFVMINLGRSDPKAKPTFGNGLSKDANTTIKDVASSSKGDNQRINISDTSRYPQDVTAIEDNSV